MQTGFIIYSAQYSRLCIYCPFKTIVLRKKGTWIGICAVGVEFRCLDIPTWYFQHSAITLCKSKIKCLFKMHWIFQRKEIKSSQENFINTEAQPMTFKIHDYDIQDTQKCDFKAGLCKIICKQSSNQTLRQSEPYLYLEMTGIYY